ncbi:MAG: protease complex subunit PrcB family protein [Deltaproteobacteria bacterium]|nr:protease complex subunit PrcB family protein [Deltaproteobacteria bacterium]
MACISLSILVLCGMGQRGDAPPMELKVDVLFEDTRGPDNSLEPSAEWIDSQAALERVYAATATLQLPAAESEPVPQIDWAENRVLLVKMGRKPTPGYAIQLHPEHCKISQDTAFISLRWSEPAPGSVLAQMITSPFILLKLEKQGYSSVNVMDQHGKTLFELPVAE